MIIPSATGNWRQSQKGHKNDWNEKLFGSEEVSFSFNNWVDNEAPLLLLYNVYSPYISFFLNLSFLPLNRFYKNADKVGKVLHVGTVVEGPSEYFSSRLSKKERKQTIVEEILGDKTLKDYSKRKYSEIQYEKSNKKKMFKTKKGKRWNTF